MLGISRIYALGPWLSAAITTSLFTHGLESKGQFEADSMPQVSHKRQFKERNQVPALPEFVPWSLQVALAALITSSNCQIALSRD